MGGGKRPPDNTKMMMEERRLERERMDRQEQQRKEELAREEARKAAEREAALGASRERVGAAYNAALDNARRQLTTRGLDPSQGYGQQVFSTVQGRYDQARAGAPEIVEDASALFAPTAFDDAYTEVRGARRGELERGARDFMGDGFEYQRFGDTSDDPILEAIVGDRYTDANSTLERALARGQINEAGYGYAQGELGNQKNAAMSRAQDFGGGVLQGYRDQLGDLSRGFNDRISNADVMDDINLDVFRTQIDDKTNALTGRMEGDIRNTIGDYRFFDTDTLLGKAGNRSGMQNNNTSPLIGSAAGSTKNLVGAFEDEKKRTVGTTGAF